MGRAVVHDPGGGERIQRVQTVWRVRPYDVSLEREGRFLRIRVKSSEYWNGSGYFCSLHGFGQRLYKRDEIDYFAVYIVPVKVWYIFPVTRLEGMSGVAVTPHRKKHKYAAYKEAWWKLQQRPTFVEGSGRSCLARKKGSH